MGVAVHQFRGKAIQNVVDGKSSLLLSYLRVEENLEQEVAEFAGEFLPIAIVDGFEDFVGFFERVGFDRVERLLAVPGTAAGTAQPGHDRHCAFEAISGARHAYKHCK